MSNTIGPKINKRDDFTDTTKLTLALRVNNHCSNPRCQILTGGPAHKSKLIGSPLTSVGVAAHIKGAAKGAKRYDPQQTPQQRKDISNGIWLCQNCAHLVDTDAHTFTVKLLHEWKEWAEDTYRQLIGTSAVDLRRQQRELELRKLEYQENVQELKLLQKNMMDTTLQVQFQHLKERGVKEVHMTPSTNQIRYLPQDDVEYVLSGPGAILHPAIQEALQKGESVITLSADGVTFRPAQEQHRGYLEEFTDQQMVLQLAWTPVLLRFTHKLMSESILCKVVHLQEPTRTEITPLIQSAGVVLKLVYQEEGETTLDVTLEPALLDETSYPLLRLLEMLVTPGSKVDIEDDTTREKLTRIWLSETTLGDPYARSMFATAVFAYKYLYCLNTLRRRNRLITDLPLMTFLKEAQEPDYRAVVFLYHTLQNPEELRFSFDFVPHSTQEGFDFTLQDGICTNAFNTVQPVGTGAHLLVYLHLFCMNMVMKFFHSETGNQVHVDRLSAALQATENHLTLSLRGAVRVKYSTTYEEANGTTWIEQQLKATTGQDWTLAPEE